MANHKNDIDDNVRARMPLIAVHVASNNDGDEYYCVGTNGVTAIEWSKTNGHHAHLLTVQVHRGDHLSAEFIYANVLGVTYDVGQDRDDAPF